MSRMCWSVETWLWTSALGSLGALCSGHAWRHQSPRASSCQGPGPDARYLEILRKWPNSSFSSWSKFLAKKTRGHVLESQVNSSPSERGSSKLRLLFNPLHVPDQSFSLLFAPVNLLWGRTEPHRTDIAAFGSEIYIPDWGFSKLNMTMMSSK